MSQYDHIIGTKRVMEERAASDTPQDSSSELDSILYKVKYANLAADKKMQCHPDILEAKAKLQRLISQEAARLAESVIGEDREIDDSIHRDTAENIRADCGTSPGSQL